MLARLSRWDVLLPGAVAVVGTVELAVARYESWAWGVVVEVIACALLCGRRVMPLVAATGAGVVVLTMPYVGPQLDDAAAPILVIAVAVYALARWVPDLRGLVGVGVILVMILGVYSLADLREHDVTDLIFVLAIVTPPFALGRLSRRLALQKDLLEERQELVRREAARLERDRIAREMHDVIAHSISAMVVQTAAAQDLVRVDPDRAEQVLADVAATGRQAIAETGRLLHVLRDDEDELGLAPAPGLADLPGLVSAFRASGLSVDLELPEPMPDLPAGVDVSAYRIAQEALTNALRYGTEQSAVLRVSSTAEGLSIEASNPSTGAGGSGAGLGLVGVAERVALLGGRVTHGMRDGRFELRASLPVVSP